MVAMAPDGQCDSASDNANTQQYEQRVVAKELGLVHTGCAARCERTLLMRGRLCLLTCDSGKRRRAN
jgi:hypothetical protein